MTHKKILLLACSALAAACLFFACVEGVAAAPSESQPDSVSVYLPESSTASNLPVSSAASSREAPASSSAKSQSTTSRSAASSSSTPAEPEPCSEPTPEPTPAPAPQPAPEPAPTPEPNVSVDAGVCIAEARAYALEKELTEDGSLHTGNSGYLNPPDISTLSQASVIADLKNCIDVYASYSPGDPSLVLYC